MISLKNLKLVWNTLEQNCVHVFLTHEDPSKSALQEFAFFLDLTQHFTRVDGRNP